MKLQINDYCIRCGICVDLYPDIFKRNYETHNIDVLFDDIPKEKEERAVQAYADCAVASIKLIDADPELLRSHTTKPLEYGN